MLYSVYSLACSYALIIIGEGERISSLNRRCKPSALLPREGVALAVVVGKRVAYLVVGYGLSAIGGKQVAPVEGRLIPPTVSSLKGNFVTADSKNHQESATGGIELVW